jgi:transposase
VLPAARQDGAEDATTCPGCGESHDLAKIKGCIKCLKCGFKFDCNGW